MVSTNLRLDASRGRQTMPCYLTRHPGGRSFRSLLEISAYDHKPRNINSDSARGFPRGAYLRIAKRQSSWSHWPPRPCKGDDIYARSLHSKAGDQVLHPCECSWWRENKSHLSLRQVTLPEHDFDNIRGSTFSAEKVSTKSITTSHPGGEAMASGSGETGIPRSPSA